MRIFDLTADPNAFPARPDTGDAPLEAVREVLEAVRTRGDAAVLELTERFDGVRPPSIRVPPEEAEAAGRRIDPALREAMAEAAECIRAVAAHQGIAAWEAEVGGGVVGETVHPVGRAGIYVPGGRAVYPSSVLMCAVPAAAAGVPSVALCTPPGPGGKVPDATLAAAHLAGVHEIYAVGGAQAIAAMAFGTASIAAVDVIAGPGNIYVALAKREVAGHVQIDSVAGPSEIAVVAGPEADPEVIAADLIAQAEHGPHGSFLLISWSKDLLEAAEQALEKDLASEGVSEDLRAAVEAGAAGVLVSGVDGAVDAVNRFAPEHLELIFEGAQEAAGRIVAAGAVFIGAWSPVSAGDYVAGSNHVLPTAGAARHASALRTAHFQRAQSFVRYDRSALERASPYIEALARAEGLPHHARAVSVRLDPKEKP